MNQLSRQAILVAEPRPGDAFPSETGGVWRLMELNEKTIVFGPDPKFTIDANPPGGHPSAEYPMGNDQYLRIIDVSHDPPSVKLELEYREGLLQDMAF